MDLSTCGSIREISILSIKILPFVGIKIPVISFNIELLPAPDFPTKATSLPDGIRNVTLFNINFFPLINVTFSK